MGILLSSVLYQVSQTEVAFWCPGCESRHILRLRSKTTDRPSWEYNGNPEKPTFQPSVLSKTGHYCDGYPKPPQCEECNDAQKEGRPTFCLHCHSFVTNGIIQFLGDCSHALANQFVPIPPYP